MHRSERFGPWSGSRPFASLRRALALGTLFLPLLLALPRGAQAQPSVDYPSSVDFGTVPVGTPSADQKVILSNLLLGDITFTSIQLAGANPGDFAFTPDQDFPCLGAPVPAFLFCQVHVTFTPSQAGLRSATLVIQTDTSPTPLMVQLTGTGQANSTALVSLICPPDQTVNAPAGQTTAVVAVGTATLDTSRLTEEFHVGTSVIAGARSDAKALTDPYPVGTTSITWTGLVAIGGGGAGGVTTGSGNLTFACAQKITVLANTRPAPLTITCPSNQMLTAATGQNSATVAVGLAFSPAGATVVGVRSDGKPLTDPYPVGITTITWSVTDSADQTATCTQTISVLPAYTFTPVVIGPSGANPHLDGLTPDRGPVGQRVMLHGTGFADVQGTSYVTLAGQQIPVLLWSAYAIDVLIDPTAFRQKALALNAAYPIQVVAPAAGKRSNMVDFLLNDAPPPVYGDNVAAPGLSDQPVLAGFQRSQFCPGDTLALLGSGFGFFQGTGYISVTVLLSDGHGGMVSQEYLVPVLSWSENAIEALLALPAGAAPGSYTVTVHRSNGKTASSSFTVSAGCGGKG